MRKWGCHPLKILEICQNHLQNTVRAAKKDGIKEEVIQHWLSNDSWYTVKNGKFVLTSVAPPEAKRSFAEWSQPRKITLRRLLRTIRAKFF